MDFSHGQVVQAVPSQKGQALLETLRARAVAAARLIAPIIPTASNRHSPSAGRGGSPAPMKRNDAGAPTQKGRFYSLTAGAPKQRFVILDQSEPSFKDNLLR